MPSGEKDWEEIRMVDVPVRPLPPKRRGRPTNRALWTENKALLIERYLYYFVLITKTGTYIDGFSAPQYPDVPNSWAARLVLESKPAWLKRFHLFELDPGKIPSLDSLKRAHPDRKISVYPGDFNSRVNEILEPGVIRPKDPSFCLIDQQTFECHWATLERVADHKGPMKIELFYFLANEWFSRAVAASTTDEGRRKIERWWGGPGWQGLRTLRPFARAQTFTRRFEQELGYASAWPYAIYKREGGTKIAYWMIHATDHPDAPMQMDRAYDKAVLPKESPGDAVQMRWDVGSDRRSSQADGETQGD